MFEIFIKEIVFFLAILKLFNIIGYLTAGLTKYLKKEHFVIQLIIHISNFAICRDISSFCHRLG